MVTIPTYVFTDAVRHFWVTRDRQVQEQRERGHADQGVRGAVTGGKQMDGFIQVISQFIISAGVGSQEIYTSSRLSDLPGYFRPTKGWDLLVVSHNELVAAIEVKSQVGSFGNNFNNRTEEAMGTAVDMWTAYREGAFRSSPQPWLGYLLILEDCEKSNTPVRVNEPHFRVFSEFRNASYARRYEIFCRKLVRERQYQAACFLMSNKNLANQQENYTEPAEDLSASRFLRDLLKHVRKE